MKSIDDIFGQVFKKLNYDFKTASERKEHLISVLNTYVNEDLDGTEKKVETILDQIQNHLDSNYFKSKIYKSQKSFLSENEKEGKYLSKLADFLLMCEDELNNNDASEFPYMTKKNFSAHKKREVLMTDEELMYHRELEQKAKKKNFKLDGRIKVTEQDRKDIKFLKDTKQAVDNLKKVLEQKCIEYSKTERDKNEIKKIKHILIEIQKDEVEIKRILKGVIYFKRLLPETTEYCFDRDTGYINEKGKYIKLTNNWIRFEIKNHIRGFLKHYDTLSSLVEYDIDSDLKHFMWVLEEYIKKCDFDDYLLSILKFKKKGYNNKEIAEKINLLYGMNLDGRNISRLINDTISTKIAYQFNKSKKQWLHSRKEDAIYKVCSKCGEELPLTSDFFNYDRSNNRFRSQCINCYNKKA